MMSDKASAARIARTMALSGKALTPAAIKRLDKRVESKIKDEPQCPDR